MKVPTEAQRSHIYTQVENATDATTAEFLVGMLPTGEDDRLATRKDVLLVKEDLELLVKGVELSVKDIETRLSGEIAVLQATTTRWMLTLLITIIAAAAAAYLAP